MKHATRIGRLAGLAVGLGMGAALAATPGIASADDFQISIDGMDLLPTAGNTATATSGMGDIAIAFGNGANATATGGLFDSAFADGTGSSAAAGIGGGDTAFASGTGSSALAGGDTVTDASGTHTFLGNDDFASALGPHTMAGSGVLFTETASSNDIAMVFDPFGTSGSEALAGIGNFDLAAAFGDTLHALATSGNFLVDIL